MTALVIGTKEREEIAALKAYAAKHPIEIAEIIDAKFAEQGKATFRLADRNPDFKRPQVRSVLIPFGFRAAYSIERQPAGLCAHLSVGVEGRQHKGAMPHPEAVRMIAEEFGISFPPNGNMWSEEYEPGEFAVNLVHLLEPTKEGNA